MKGIALIVTFIVANVLWANDVLINEVKSLRNSLSYQDPAKQELTLRLADLYFNGAIGQNGETESSAKATTYQKNALRLYKEVYTGKNGMKAIDGEASIKVAFQIARIQERLGMGNESIPYYEKVLQSSLSTSLLKKQSALALADYWEKKDNWKNSLKYYNQSIQFCKMDDTCNYVRYRKAWLHYKIGELAPAIENMRLSLWDKKGQIREQSLRDFIVFISNDTTEGFEELKEIESLSKKINRPGLLRDLAEAFYTAGNRKAGTNVLAHINSKKPNFYYNIRLMEEFYGFRSWDDVDQYLSAVENESIADVPVDEKESKEIVKIFRRIIVQLDAESKQNSQAKPYLKRSIETYLKHFPRDEMRKKMQEGWLAVVDDNNEKIEKLKTWIVEGLQNDESPKDIRQLRQTRLSLAQKEKLVDIEIEESLALSEMEVVSPNERREFQYVAARAYYGQKNYDNALPIFKKLASQGANASQADKWAILSQNLVLDIYNTQKNYQGIIDQVNSWKKNSSLQANSGELSNEMQSMIGIAKKATFEKAVVGGESQESLATFYQYCMNNEETEKSCSNAKVLAVKLQDQEKLVKILEKLGDKKALMNEYELMGRFASAAKLHEELEAKELKTDLELNLKVALLYELANDQINRKKTYERIVSIIKKNKAIPEQYEALIFQNLKEMGMIDVASLSLPWKKEKILGMADEMEWNKSSKVTKNIIMNEGKYTGPAWARYVLQEVESLDQKQRAITFYGRNSQSKFKKRVTAIEKMMSKAQSYLDGSNLETRIYLLNILESAYSDFSQEILNSPIPDNVPAEMISQVKDSLAQMAQPFIEVKDKYSKLKVEQIAQITDEKLKTKVMNLENQKVANYSSLIQPWEQSFLSADVKKIETVKVAKINNEIKKLEENPLNPEALLSLENIYQESDHKRLSSYFKMRREKINDTQQEAKL